VGDRLLGGLLKAEIHYGDRTMVFGALWGWMVKLVKLVKPVSALWRAPSYERGVKEEW